MLDDESGDSFDAEMFEDRYHSEYAMAPRSSRVTYPRRPSRVLDDRSRDPQSARGQLQRYERISTPKTDAIQKIIIQVDNTRLRDAYKCTIMLRLVDTNRDRKKSKILDNMPQCTEMSGVSDCPQFQRNAFCFKLSAPLSKDSCEKIVLRVMRQGEGAAKTEHGVGVLQLSMAADNVKHAGSYTKTVTFTMKSAKAADGDVYIGSTDVSVGKIANF